MYDLVLELPHRNTMTLQMDIDGRWWGCGYPATRLYVAMPCAMQVSQRSLQYGRLTIWLRTNAMAIAHRTNGMIKIFQKISYSPKPTTFIVASSGFCPRMCPALWNTYVGHCWMVLKQMCVRSNFTSDFPEHFVRLNQFLDDYNCRVAMGTYGNN